MTSSSSPPGKDNFGIVLHHGYFFGDNLTFSKYFLMKQSFSFSCGFKFKGIIFFESSALRAAAFMAEFNKMLFTQQQSTGPIFKISSKVPRMN